MINYKQEQLRKQQIYQNINAGVQLEKIPLIKSVVDNEFNTR